MIDREKVIKSMEMCIAPSYECSPDECSYYDKPRNESGLCWDRLMADAITLLKEQEAAPVVQREIMHMLFWCCGSCGIAITDGDKFCRNCGRSVKWE